MSESRRFQALASKPSENDEAAGVAKDKRKRIPPARSQSPDPPQEKKTKRSSRKEIWQPMHTPYTPFNPSLGASDLFSLTKEQLGITLKVKFQKFCTWLIEKRPPSPRTLEIDNIFP